MNVILGRPLDANGCLQLIWRNRAPITHLLNVQSSSSSLDLKLISNKIFSPHANPFFTICSFHTFSKLAAYFENSSPKRETLSEDYRNKQGNEIKVAPEDEQNAKKILFDDKKIISRLIKYPGLYNRSTPVEALVSQNRKSLLLLDGTQIKDKIDEEDDVKGYKVELQPSNSGKLTHLLSQSLDTQLEIAPNSKKRRKKGVNQQPDIVKVKLIDIKYPFKNRSKDVAVKTVNFKECQSFFKSQGIPHDELESYPDVQMLSKDEILNCVAKLKELHIHRVFSLFLIRRIHFEMTAGESYRIKNNIRRLTELRTVQCYLELCQALNKPDLDIRGVMDKLAELGSNNDIIIILKKVKKLISVGATPEDILNNLEILVGYEFFFEKIELYEKTLLHTAVSRFPVKLFLAKNLNCFKEQLAVGDEIQEITSLLGVSLTEFQACWGFRIKNSVELKFKIKMCLRAGISKQDIFNHLKMLDSFPVEKCHAATKCFRTSGLPASVYVLHNMLSTLEMNGGTHTNSDKTTESSSDWTCHADDASCSSPSTKKSKPRTGKILLSTKKLRKQIFFMISNLLKLDNGTVTNMYESGIDVSSMDVQDVAKNLEFLKSAGFTLKQVTACPLILAHPNKDLIRVAKEAKTMVLNSLQSSQLPHADTVVDLPTGTLPNTILHSNGSQLLTDSCIGSDPPPEEVSMAEVLFASPERHLNILQYLLEKENCFSLASTEGQKVSGFVDLKV